MEVTKGGSEQNGTRIDGLDKTNGMEKAGNGTKGDPREPREPRGSKWEVKQREERVRN